MSGPTGLLPLTGCPDRGCRAPAEITRRRTVPASPEPVVLVSTYCVNQHHHTMTEGEVMARAKE